MRLFWFLSKIENNNGFGAIGLNLFRQLRVCGEYSLYLCIYVLFSLVYFDLECMRNLRNEHHLAAKSGTVFCLF